MPKDAVIEPELTDAIRRALYRVHWVLGPGFFHQVYRRATMVEFQRSGIGHAYIKQIPVYFEGECIGQQESRVIAVENKVLVGTVAQKEITNTDLAKFRSRMRNLDLRFGILANFHPTKLHLEYVQLG